MGVMWLADSLILAMYVDPCLKADLCNMLSYICWCVAQIEPNSEPSTTGDAMFQAKKGPGHVTVYALQ